MSFFSTPERMTQVYIYGLNPAMLYLRSLNSLLFSYKTLLQLENVESRRKLERFRPCAFEILSESEFPLLILYVSKRHCIGQGLCVCAPVFSVFVSLKAESITELQIFEQPSKLSHRLLVFDLKTFTSTKIAEVYFSLKTFVTITRFTSVHQIHGIFCQSILETLSAVLPTSTMFLEKPNVKFW